MPIVTWGINMGTMEYIKKTGLKKIIQAGIQHVIGLGRIQEEVDSLYYFLNTYCDITTIPPTKDENLRLMQLALVELLKIFDEICKQNNLTYWLDAGQLIGAIRHKGFIPWDDDLDVAMPREDYDKAYPLFKDILDKYGIIVNSGGLYDDFGYMQRIGFNYKTAETGVWLDVFPIDIIKAKKELSEDDTELNRAIKQYRHFYKRNEKRKSVELLSNQKKEIFSKYHNLTEGNVNHYLYAPEFMNTICLFKEEDIFPLRKHQYEGFEFSIPNNPLIYLKKEYGSDCMDFPRYGILHHNDPDGGNASTRAIRHNINMKDEIAYLQSVYDEICREHKV